MAAPRSAFLLYTFYHFAFNRRTASVIPLFLASKYILIGRASAEAFAYTSYYRHSYEQTLTDFICFCVFCLRRGGSVGSIKARLFGRGVFGHGEQDSRLEGVMPLLRTWNPSRPVKQTGTPSQC